MDCVEKQFFDKFNIGPCIKKGQRYFVTDVRFHEQEATQDIYPSINAQCILDLEEILLNLSQYCTVEISKDKEPLEINYGYVFTENTENGDYHHGFCHEINNHRKTRKEALLSVLMDYSYNESIYNGVRNVFGVHDAESQKG